MPTEEEIKRLQKREQYLSSFRRLKIRLGALSPLSSFNRFLLPLVLLLIVLSVGVWLRMQPLYMYPAEKTVDAVLEERLSNQFLLEVHNEYPTLPLADKERFAQNRLEQFKKLPDYQKQRTQDIARLKDLLAPDDGFIYPLDLDSYHHLFYTKNVLKYGSMSDKVVDGQKYDTFKYPPIGKARDNEHFFPYFAAWFYRLTNFLFDWTLLESFVFIPVFLSAVLITLFFFFGKRIAGLAGGFFISFLVAVDTILGNRGVLGFTDTDMLNLILSLLILFMAYLAFESLSLTGGISSPEKSFTKNKFFMKNQWFSLLFIVLGAFFVGLFAFTWTGWWYIFIIVLISIALFIVYFFWRERKISSLVKWGIFLFIVFFLVSGLFVSLFVGFSHFVDLFVAPFRVSSTLGGVFSTSRGDTNLFPNIYHFFVDELQSQNLSIFLKNLGLLNLVISFLGFLCLSAAAYFAMRQNNQSPHQHPDQHQQRPLQHPSSLIFLFFLFLVFSVSTGYIAFRSLRFSYYFALMLPFFSGYFFSYFFTAGAEKISLSFRLEKKFIQIVLLIFFIIFTGFSPFPPFCDHGACKQSFDLFREKPLVYDDAMDSLMQELKTKSASDALVTLWWDDGNFVKAMAERRATIDSASQDLPHLVWISRFLSTDNENEAISILRMLGCGSYYPYFRIFPNETRDSRNAFKIVENLVAMDKAEAKTYLQNLVDQRILSEETVPALLNETKCSPPEGYVFTSNKLLNFANIWSSYAFFDIDRAKIYSLKDNEQEASDFMTRQLNYTVDQVQTARVQVENIQTDQDFLRWVSPFGGPTLHLVEGLCQSERSPLPLPSENQNARVPSAQILQCKVPYQGGILTFFLDMAKKEISYPNRQPQSSSTAQDVFKSLVWVDDFGFHEKQMDPAGITAGDTAEKNRANRAGENTADPESLSLIFTRQTKGNKILVLAAKNPLQRSMYVRLNYLGGVGLSKFALFDSKTSFVHGNIYLWNVLWDSP